MKITREIKTAILVIASILLFIWGYSFLKGRDLLTDYKTFYVDYENVEGLAKSAPVTINGLVVGKVNSINLSNDTGKLIVELQINSDFPISKSSVATIYESGLIGGKQVMIIPNLNDKTLAETGSKLIGDNKQGMTALVGEKLEPLQQKLEKVLQSADVMINNINNVLDAKTQSNLKNAIAELDKTMANFTKLSTNANQLIDDNKVKLSSAVSNLDKTTQNFAKISTDLENAKLGEIVKSLENTLANVNKIMANLESGKGTMGKLLTDDVMYTNLTKTSKELELLLQDLRLHPTRYVNVSLFGKKEKPYIKSTDTIKN